MILTLLDYASVFVFALTGALAASRAQLDIIGFAFLACLTAVGGGTVRDLLLDRNPVFWMADPGVILIAVAAAITVYFSAHLVESRLRLLIWLDSFALAVAVAAGTGVAIALDQPTTIVVIMGVTTGCFGGLMRDVVANEVPVILRQGELYATAALAGSSTALILLELGFPSEIRLLGCAIITWILRAGSLRFGWQLPLYKSTPPREK
ncbi:trimeric intracellular cation channel family protein [Phaeobacter sp. J2-8]|uniref:trimeric intracellular cation channel family protein n=1 Tax=Phaeobacter sp. J2-8 TaxID=2931394 RepID=UPI001FD4D037|nr:trimeric intracellular cation channel family protein [Phaeobacter sp. J2-8]MCJ7871201.1 trimeric intracellular cation channel family protein [Phaeobacter sp. J2-8]